MYPVFQPTSSSMGQCKRTNTWRCVKNQRTAVRMSSAIKKVKVLHMSCVADIQETQAALWLPCDANPFKNTQKNTVRKPPFLRKKLNDQPDNLLLLSPRHYQYKGRFSRFNVPLLSSSQSIIERAKEHFALPVLTCHHRSRFLVTGQDRISQISQTTSFCLFATLSASQNGRCNVR